MTALNTRRSTHHIDICTKCDKPLRSKYLFNPFVGHEFESYQCDRVWCRLIHGFYLRRSWIWKYSKSLRDILRWRVKIQFYQLPDIQMVKVRRQVKYKSVRW